MRGVPPAPLVVAVSLSGASIAGAIHLAFGHTPFAPGAAALTATGMTVLTLVAVSGVLLARGRWSRSTAVVVASGWIALGASGDLALAGATTIGLATIALSGALGPWLRRWVRHRPAVEGPPPAAVALLLLLLAVPVAVGVSASDGVTWTGWVVAAWSLTLALALARTLPGALLAVRLLHAPACLAAGAVVGGLRGAMLVGGVGLAAAAFGWRGEVAAAVDPGVGGPGVTLRIPPELAPPGVLDAAGVDERGAS